ncbi:hypothetical protein [Paenibacillus humicus]|uniref:hypothetical protein n=1 Tax=Paenibacillus humicus TaxID=412861 RepID=UPI003D29B537
MNQSVFANLPGFVRILAKPTDDGLYQIHLKVSDHETKTYPNEVSLREALEYTGILQRIFGVPDEGVLISANKAVVDMPNVDNRKLKKFLMSKGVMV